MATGWTVRGSNFDGDKIYRTRPNRKRSPHNHLKNGHRVSFTGVKRPGRGVKHPTQYSAEVKETVELYIYSPPGPSWPAIW